MRNRLADVDNMFQTDYKRVLCVCSAGLLRSPTAAVVLESEPFNFNTRAAGITTEYALIPVDQVLLTWADEIVCMEPIHSMAVSKKLEMYKLEKPILTLNILDEFSYMDKQLQKMIQDNYSNCDNGGEL